MSLKDRVELASALAIAFIQTRSDRDTMSFIVANAVGMATQIVDALEDVEIERAQQAAEDALEGLCMKPHPDEQSNVRCTLEAGHRGPCRVESEQGAVEW